MAKTRTHPVINPQAHAAAVGEYKRDGYRILDEQPGQTILEHRSWGGLLAHLALFFTVGWLTLGLLNLLYGLYVRQQTADRVAVVTQ